MNLSYLFLSGRILLTGCERIVVNRLGQNTESLSGAFVYFGTATIFLVPCLFIVPVPESFHFLVIAAASGFVYSFAFWLFVKSLTSGDVSLVAPLYHYNVFFLMALTALFLNEHFSLDNIFEVIYLKSCFYNIDFLFNMGILDIKYKKIEKAKKILKEIIHLDPGFKKIPLMEEEIKKAGQ